MGAVDAVRRGPVRERHGCGRPGCLPERRARAHDARRGKPHVRHRDVAAGEHQVRHVHGVEAAQRNLERRRRLVGDSRVLPVEEGVWMVVVQRPSSVCHDVREPPPRHDVALRADVRAYEASRLPLARQSPNPVELVAAAASVRMVLHVLPHAVCDALELELYSVRVPDGVDVASILYPPEVVVPALAVLWMQPLEGVAEAVF